MNVCLWRVYATAILLNCTQLILYFFLLIHVLYTSKRWLACYALLRFTRPPPSLEIIYDRIRDESHSSTTIMCVGSDRNFNSFLPTLLSAFENGLERWQCSCSNFCLLLLRVTYILYASSLNIRFTMFFFSMIMNCNHYFECIKKSVLSLL